MQRLAAPPHSKRVDGWMDGYKKKEIYRIFTFYTVKFIIHIYEDSTLSQVSHKLQSVCLVSTADYSRKEGIKM